MTYTLDKTDKAILRVMQKDARKTLKEISAEVNLSSTPVFERIRKMERAGYIKRYVAILNAQKLNLGFMVFCNVRLRQINTEIAKHFVERVNALDRVSECYNVSGTYDFLLKVHATDMQDYQQFLMDELGAIENVAHIESTFVMKEEKQEYGVRIL